MVSALSFADRASRSFWRLIPARVVSSAIGRGARLHIPVGLRASLLRGFARRYGIDASKAEKALEEYGDLDEFFTRRLRAGERPIDQAPLAIVSPSDGTVVESGRVTEGKLLQAKGMLFGLADLLADADVAARLEGGAYLITYLAPSDYHRVHSPVAGNVVGWQHIPGTLFTVNVRSVAREPGIFSRNERFVSVIEGEAGLCAVVMVAAVGVGHVTASFDPEVATHASGFGNGIVRRKRFESARPLGRGDELGIFHLGSTTIVVFEPGRAQLEMMAPGSRTLMGERIGKILPRKRDAS